jgi:dTDP-4-dehydrorhamnose 3,5-epimerase
MEKAILFDSGTFLDNRGSFTPLSLELFDKTWLQSNVSVNDKRNTFRGLHFQKGEFAQAKLLKVIHGEIIDYIVDLREDSEDYMKLQEFKLTRNNALLVPRGFAHGFITTEKNTIVQYLVDNVYNKESEGTLFWNEVPELRKKFKGKDLIMSEKDKPNEVIY